MNLLSSIFGAPRSPQPASDVDVAEAQRRLAAGALLVDVREPSEWQEGHVAGARHVPLGSIGARLAELPMDREILLICRSGGRSSSAQGLLRRQGYAQALNVSGGMTAWLRAGLPISRK